MVLAVNADHDPREKLQRFVDGKGLSQRVLLGGNGVANKDYYIRAFPTKYLIDRRGKIVERKYGPENLPELKKKVEKLLGSR